MPALLDVPAVADRLGLTQYQVRAEHARGILPGRKVSRLLRFTEDDIEIYLERIRDDRASNTSGLTHLSRVRRRKP